MGQEMRHRRVRFILRCGLGSTLLTGVGLLAGVGASATQPRTAAHGPQDVPVSGAVYAWGDDDAGQLGVGTISTSGHNHDAAVPEASDMPAGTTSDALAAGQSHSLFVTTAGVVYATGFNKDGQLGTGNNVATTSPVPADLPADVDITAVAAGYKQSLALSSSGTLYAWGADNYGQAGNGTKGKNVFTPVVVPLPRGATASAIGVGINHDLAVTSTGSVYDWGWNSTGQLGNGKLANSDVPVEAQLPAGVVATAVAGGAGHSLALTSTDSVYAWGDNTHGQVGDGTTTDSSVPVLVDLPVGVTVTAIAAGDGDVSGLTGGYSLALTSTGAIYAWGDNASGNLGDGGTTDSDVPVLVQVPNGITVTGMSAGGNRCQLLTSTGVLYNWGTNEKGGAVVLTPALDKLPAGETPVLLNDGPDAEQYLVLMVPSGS
jgi:alpha-tubulin suppressor-like RCC1 family protein